MHCIALDRQLVCFYTSANLDWQEAQSCRPVRPSVRYQTWEHDILKTNEPILLNQLQFSSSFAISTADLPNTVLRGLRGVSVLGWCTSGNTATGARQRNSIKDVIVIGWCSPSVQLHAWDWKLSSVAVCASGCLSALHHLHHLSL